MNIAAQTWALVVGIDQYADQEIPQLQGAVADAVAVADWLQTLGVPDDQVLFHAAPTKNSRAVLKGRKPKKASAQEIDASIVALEKVKGGRRLIVYLAGHGIYEADAGRLFLVEEFKRDSPSNMDLEQYIRRFLSMPFERQFLFVDGCQNLPYSDGERQKITGQMFGGAAGKPIRPQNRLVACFAASVTQRAYEVEGRGVFTRRLLEAIDLKDPWSKAVFLDFETGESFLDVSKAMFDYVKPSVEDDVRDTLQTPYVQSFPGETTDVFPFYSFLEPSPPGNVTVQVAPDVATTEIESVVISGAADQPWSFSQPRPPRRALEVPFTVRIPVGRDITANCVMKRGSLWAGTLEKRLQVGTQTQVIFELNPATEQTPLAVELQTIDAGGRPISYQFSYDEVGARLGLGDQTRGHNALGVNLIEREIGPIFEAARGAPADAVIASRRLAGDWAREIQELTSGEVGVSTIVTGVAREGLRPKLRFTLPRGTAARLAGPLSHSPVVWIGLSEDAPATPLSGSEYLPGTWTLATIETAPEVEVHPGHQLVRIDLPWGSWSATVIASPGGITDVELPSSIGDPPLRVLLNEELERKGSFLFGVGGRTPRPLLRNGLAGREAIDYRQAREGSARWAFAAPSAAWIRKPGAVAIATAGGWSFPHLYGRSLGLAYVGRRRHVRIEPLSRVPSAAWDLLLGRGLLDVLSEEEAALLTYNKYDDPLLGLAGAYAVYALPTAKNKDQFLTTVVANLRRLSEQPGGMKVPDIDLLSAAHTARTAKRATPTDEAILESWATRGAVPVLRWGVPLAVRLIQDGVLSGPSFERWHGELQRINENLSPISVWTAWRPTRARRLGSPSRDRATPPSSS